MIYLFIYLFELNFSQQRAQLIYCSLSIKMSLSFVYAPLKIPKTALAQDKSQFNPFRQPTTFPDSSNRKSL